MAKRPAPGPFTAAPIIQGKFDGSGVPDALTFPRGSQIDDSFYENYDAHQGTIAGWWKPEKTRTTGAKEYLWYLNSNAWCRYDHTENRLYARTAGQSVLTYFSTTAGTLYFIALRWDTNNTLDGSNRGCISVNDVHTFDADGSVSVTSPSTVIELGSENSLLYPANAIQEGFIFYRRPLFDGTYGIDVGNGDELNKMWAAGAGKDPCLVTGSWDVCFCLPTNSTVEELVTGTGEAWSHPHSSNLLGVGGFMFDGTYTNDGWADAGTPTAVAALASVEKIFPGGYKVTSDAANEGIYKDYTCTEYQDFVIRVIAHSDGTSVPKVVLRDQTGSVVIADLTGSNGSTRTAPDVLIFTGEAPAGCTTLRVKLINSQSSGITFWHQCELLTNGVNRPSLETGAGDPWMPTGYSNISLDAGDTEFEASIVHSGAGSIQFNANAASGEYVRQNGTYFGDAVGRFVSAGAWFYNGGYVSWRTDRVAKQTALTSVLELSGAAVASWKHAAAVGRLLSTPWFQIYGNSAVHYVDDLYGFFLDDVSLTVTPASEANSQENGGIQVTGLDHYVQLRRPIHLRNI
jgi:hypothetical protein